MLEFSNCKINIGLHITARRPDGYHDIETVFYPVNWCDILELVPAAASRETSLQISGQEIPGNTSNNLCLRAYELLKKEYALGPVELFLHKILPTGAGLGGGSSNAAYTLLMLNKLYKLNLDIEALKSYAAQLGSDCSFFIENKPCYARGRGEITEALALDLSSWYILLVKPPVHVSTAEAYAGVIPKKPLISLKESILLPVESWKESIRNDFEDSVFLKYKDLEKIKQQLYSMGAAYAAMSGSGSTIYGIFRTMPDAENLFPGCLTWKGQLKPTT